TVKAQGRTKQGAFQARSGAVVTHDAVGQAERIVVHRPGGRYADTPVASAAGVILHAGIGAGLQYFHDGRLVGEIGQAVGGDVALAEEVAGDDLPQILQV